VPPVAQKLAVVAQKTDRLPKNLTDNQHLSLTESDTSSVAQLPCLKKTFSDLVAGTEFIMVARSILVIIPIKNVVKSCNKSTITNVISFLLKKIFCNNSPSVVLD
jgi:hypothetical protein